MPPNLYGQGDNYHPMNSHVLPSMINNFYTAKIKNLGKVTCWGTGSPMREFLYVDDLAEASIFTLENISTENRSLYDDQNNFNGILNVGVGKEISIKELAEQISSIVGYQGRIIWDSMKPDGTPRKLLDISKMKKLGWEAKTDLKEGIRKTLEFYKNEFHNKSIRS